jgi:hypothetical protein
MRYRSYSVARNSQFLHTGVKRRTFTPKRAAAPLGPSSMPLVLQSPANEIALSILQSDMCSGESDCASGFKPMSGARSVLPDVRITLRSTKFRSSRIFPGQLWPAAIQTRWYRWARPAELASPRSRP